MAGPFTSPVTRLAEMLADTTAFADWVNNAPNPPATVIERIHLNMVFQTERTRPFAVISARTVSSDWNHQDYPTGTIGLTVISEDLDLTPTGVEASWVDYYEKFGRVRQDLLNIQYDLATKARLAIGNITLDQEAQMVDVQDIEPYINGIMLIDYGISKVG